MRESGIMTLSERIDRELADIDAMDARITARAQRDQLCAHCRDEKPRRDDAVCQDCHNERCRP